MDAGYGMRDLGYGIWDVGYGISGVNPESKIQYPISNI